MPARVVHASRRSASWDDQSRCPRPRSARRRCALRSSRAGRRRSAPDRFEQSSTPSPVTPEICVKHGSPCVRTCPSRRVSRVGIVERVHLVGATICGFAATAGSNSRSSSRIISKSSTGSRPDAPDTSTRCTSTFVRSMCRRNRSPRPWPSCAPSISPGTSATTKLRSSLSVTTPRFGMSVVNG